MAYRYLKKYKYNVKTCMYTLSKLYQMINLNKHIVETKMMSLITHPDFVPNR